jgi:hypothetical protein
MSNKSKQTVILMTGFVALLATNQAISSLFFGSLDPQSCSDVFSGTAMRTSNPLVSHFKKLCSGQGQITNAVVAGEGQAGIAVACVNKSGSNITLTFPKTPDENCNSENPQNPESSIVRPVPGSNWTADFGTFATAEIASHFLNSLLSHPELTAEYQVLIESVLNNGREFRMADQETPTTNIYTNVTYFPESLGAYRVGASFAHELGHGIDPSLLDFYFAPDKEIFSHQWMKFRPNHWRDFQRATWDPANPDTYSVSEEYCAIHFENQIDWMLNYAHTEGYTATGLKHHYRDPGHLDDAADEYSDLKSGAQEYFSTHTYIDPSIPH